MDRSMLYKNVLVTASIILSHATLAASGEVTRFVDDNAHADPGPGDPQLGDPLEDGSPNHPFDSIQEAIDASANGDIVVVLNGVYAGDGNRNLDFAGRAITVKGQSGPQDCIIDCGGYPNRGFYFHSGETPASVISALTIRNGNVGSDSLGDNRGGGIYCAAGSSPTIENCIILENTGWLAGGIYAGGNSLIRSCTISGNSGEFGAGGIQCLGKTMVVNCVITGNKLTTHYPYGYLGGGVSCSAEAVVVGCSIIGNTAPSNNGGGVACGGSCAVVNCSIMNNRARKGGGLRVHGNSVVANCLIAGNTASTRGEAIYSSSNYAVSPRLLNCTLVGNGKNGDHTVSTSGEHVLLTIENCVLWNPVPTEILADYSSQILVSYSNVKMAGTQVWPGVGNMNADPLFAYPGSEEYRLSAESPCVNTGDPDFVAGPSDVDIGGTARMLCGRVDVGAYEFGVGDYNCDRVMDLLDFSYWPSCASGPDASAASMGCEAFDFAFDRHIDLRDYAEFLELFAAP